MAFLVIKFADSTLFMTVQWVKKRQRSKVKHHSNQYNLKGKVKAYRQELMVANRYAGKCDPPSLIHR